MKRRKTMKALAIALVLALGMSTLGCDTDGTPDTPVIDETNTEVDNDIATENAEKKDTNELQKETEDETAEIEESMPSEMIALDITMYVISNCNAMDIPVSGTNKESLKKDDKVTVIGQDITTGWYLLESGYFVNNTYLSETKGGEAVITPTTNTTTANNSTSTTKPSTGTTNTTNKPNTNTSTTKPNTSTTTTPSTSNNTTTTSTTPTTTACQHKNTYRDVVSYRQDGCAYYETYQKICGDCGEKIGSPYEELVSVDHIIVQTNVIEQEWICGVQDGRYHIHYECACGAINYDDESRVSKSKEHELRVNEWDDVDAKEHVVQTWCAYCPYSTEVRTPLS